MGVCNKHTELEQELAIVARKGGKQIRNMKRQHKKGSESFSAGYFVSAALLSARSPSTPARIPCCSVQCM